MVPVQLTSAVAAHMRIQVDLRTSSLASLGMSLKTFAFNTCLDGRQQRFAVQQVQAQGNVQGLPTSAEQGVKHRTPSASSQGSTQAGTRPSSEPPLEPVQRIAVLFFIRE